MQRRVVGESVEKGVPVAKDSQTRMRSVFWLCLGEGDDPGLDHGNVLENLPISCWESLRIHGPAFQAFQHLHWKIGGRLLQGFNGVIFLEQDSPDALLQLSDVPWPVILFGHVSL